MAARWVKMLGALQEIDLRIRSLRTKLSLIPREKEALKRRAAANKAGLQKVKDKVLAAEAAIRSAEAAVAGFNDAVARLQQQSALVKKNTEYQAMMAQIADYQQKIGDQESVILETMDQLELYREEYKNAARETEAANATLKDEFYEFKQLESDLQAEIERLDASREPIARPIEQAVLDRYQLLIAKDPGTPLVKIENGICGNCHLRITPQTMNEARKGAVASCDNCQHFVYLDEVAE